MYKDVVYNGLIFTIYTPQHSLIEITRNDELCSETIPELFIPHFLPTGERIDYLSKCFCGLPVDKVVIDDGILVEDRAFYKAKIKEVVWPKSCTAIPNSCFMESFVEKVSNIEDVTKIGLGAFVKSEVAEFVWPSGCTVIPQGCFMSSPLTKISNIDHVVTIKAYAFECCDFESFVWPSNCPIVPVQCFSGNPLKSISNITNISVIKTNAFGHLRGDFSVDLSGSAITQMEVGAFSCCDPDNIVMPYYVSESDKENALRVEEII